MILINNKWTDKNENYWSANIYTEEEARIKSESLLNCTRCYNCSDCSDCSGCSYCTDCTGCTRCSWCTRCYNCSDCSDCSGCSYCTDCTGCTRCSCCTDFHSNPQRFTSRKIGSRKSQTTVYWTDEKTLVVCGCFRGDLEAFKREVLKTHENNELYKKEYLNLISLIEKLIEESKK